MFPKGVGWSELGKEGKWSKRVYGECTVSGTDFLELPQLLFFLMKKTNVFKEKDGNRTLREIRDARYMNSFLPS